MAQHHDRGTGGRLAYRPREFAAVTGMSDRSVRYLMKTGRLGYVRIGRTILIRASDAEQLLRRYAVRAAALQDAEAPIRPKAKRTAEREPTAEGQ